MQVVRPFLIALQFLTILPVRLKEPIKNEDVGRSLLYYPVVGLIIGFLLSVFTWWAVALPHTLQAALLLLLWVALTGALHLDGLADSADAWIGGLGDRDKTLAIMKDPYCGPTAVVTLILLLLIKFVTLEQILIAGEWRSLLLAPVLARTAMPLLFLTTAYVRTCGLGTQMSLHQPHHISVIMILLTFAAVPLVAGIMGWWMLFTVMGLFFLLRALMVRRTGGITGDTAGAMVELIEVGVL
ncbi:MAG: adenosylcobinamide-GDP ribazoletransferase, partial [Halobacteria archaeon]|nr:adenosylcobinamide-GDP ribazoletransferase [Halobacteria archaeon]